jgi:hypothetical protein
MLPALISLVTSFLTAIFIVYVGLETTPVASFYHLMSQGSEATSATSNNFNEARVVLESIKDSA